MKATYWDSSTRLSVSRNSNHMFKAKLKKKKKRKNLYIMNSAKYPLSRKKTEIEIEKELNFDKKNCKITPISIIICVKHLF